MKSKEKLIFPILLLMFNALGCVGTLTVTLQFEPGSVSERGLFLWGLGLLCVLSGLFWRRGSQRRLLLRGAVLLAVYGICIFIFRRELANGLAWALDGAVERLNSRYDIHLVWSWEGEPGSPELMRAATLSVLTVLVPYILLLGYGVMRSHVIVVILADALWFAAACGMDEFPAYVWLVLRVLGLGTVVVRRAYRDNGKGEVGAVLFGTAVLAVIMLLVYRFMLPAVDAQYEKLLEARVELHQKINEEWIPRLRDSFAQFGSGGGVDVTGELDRAGGTVYTSREIYQVTMDAAPNTAVYLKGFVGKDYAGDEWKEEKDSVLERYYRAWGWELPESGGELVNLTYGALRQPSSGYVRLEELAGAGSYSIYPYGAEMTEDYKVHWDGSVERKGSVYEFPYCAPESGNATGKLVGVQAEEELRYRSYVYDNFCEYPEEQLPRLTEFLEESGFRQGDLYESLADVLSYLRSSAVYNLDAGNTPEGEDFVEYFLFESQEGYCAHFASAAVLMLRYLGVPARYATGYSVSADTFTKDETGAYTAVVTDMQAHAWAEVYLDGVGWIPVEMTPGAAAFTRDNSIEQLELAGRLSGAFAEDSGETDFPETEADVLAEPGEDSDGEPEEAGAELQPEQEKRPSVSDGPKQAEQENSRPESAGAEESGSDSAGEKTDVAGKNSSGGEKGWELSPFAAAVLKVALLTAVCALLCFGGIRLARRSCYRRFCRENNREKIFLLYGNLKRLLWLSGHLEKLEGEEASEFNRILEKSSFGPEKPGKAELQAVMDFCRRLAGEEYESLPLYKRPLYKCMNVYNVPEN